MMTELEAAAKATEEVAKTAGKAIDASSSLGRFFERIFGPALLEFGSQLQDSARLRRAANLLKLKQKWDRLRAEHREAEEPSALPFKFGVALIEAAALEEEDELQELFAKLLYNTTSTKSGIETRVAFVSLLREMSGFDVRLLLAIASAPNVTPGFVKSVYTSRFPTEFIDKDGLSQEDWFVEPSEIVAVSLYNLIRLGCLAPAMRMNGVITVAQVTYTPLGEALVQALTVPGADPQPRPA